MKLIPFASGQFIFHMYALEAVEHLLNYLLRTTASLPTGELYSHEMRRALNCRALVKICVERQANSWSSFIKEAARDVAARAGYAKVRRPWSKNKKHKVLLVSRPVALGKGVSYDVPINEPSCDPAFMAKSRAKLARALCKNWLTPEMAEYAMLELISYSENIDEATGCSFTDDFDADFEEYDDDVDDDAFPFWDEDDYTEHDH